MIYVYVAGPFTAKPEEIDKCILRYSIPALPETTIARDTAARIVTEGNIERAKLLGVEVAKLGACPIIPHANTDHPEFESVQPYEFWIRATLGMVRMCHAMIMVPGWEASSGARGEYSLAKSIKQPVFYDCDELKTWLEEQRIPV